MEMEKRDLPVKESEKSSMEKAARISSEIFTYGKVRWRMGVRPFRLLMMVAQTIASERDKLTLFPEYVFPLDKVFKYLGVEKSNRRYELLAEDLKEFLNSSIDQKTYTKRGARRWRGMSFITYYELNEDTSSLHLQINENAHNFFIGMKRWSALQPKFYLRLSTEYQNWFYTFLKKELNFRTSIEIPIDILKEMLYLEDSVAYDLKKTSTANINLFKRVIGIEKPKGWEYKSKGVNKPWDYTKNSKGDIIGTLGLITLNTDMNVSAFPIKKGRNYISIHFDISAKAKYMTNAERERAHKEATKHDIQDMGKPTKRVSTKQPSSIADLFAHTPVLETNENPENTSNDIPTGECRISYTTMREVAKAQNSTPERIAKKMGYELQADGTYIKHNQ